jgi:hypothetical protein
VGVKLGFKFQVQSFKFQVPGALAFDSDRMIAGRMIFFLSEGSPDARHRLLE